MHPEGRIAWGQVHLFEHSGHQAALVIRVINDEIGLQPDVGPLATEDASADGMERPDHQLADVRADEVSEARDHLPGGLVGKGHRQDPVGVHALFLDQVGDAVGEDARLARAGAGQHEHGPVGGAHGLLLGGVQTVEGDRHSEKQHSNLVGRSVILSSFRAVGKAEG